MSDDYSPYQTRLGRAIERGEGLKEITTQAIFTLGRVKHKASKLNTRQGWQDILDLIKDEPFVPFPIRTKLNIAHRVAHDIGFFIKENPNATKEDVKDEVTRLVQVAEAEERESENKQQLTLQDEKAVKEILTEISDRPDEASESLMKIFKRATSLAAHENMKEYSKHISYLVPFPWNINFAIFTATYHMRLAGMSLYNHFRKKPIDQNELEKQLYKNHLSRALEHVANGVSDSGAILIPFLKRVPGIGYLANYVLRNTVGKVLKHTAEVLDEDTKEIQGSVSKILSRTFHKESFDKDTVAMMIAKGVNSVAESDTTEIAQGVAVSYRYSRLTKTISFADEIARATFGYAVLGAPTGEKRRENFLIHQVRKESEEHLRRNQRARKMLRDAHRAPRPSQSLMITPLTGKFNDPHIDRRSSMHLDVRLQNGLIDRTTTSLEADMLRIKDME